MSNRKAIHLPAMFMASALLAGLFATAGAHANTKPFEQEAVPLSIVSRTSQWPRWFRSAVLPRLRIQ